MTNLKLKSNSWFLYHLIILYLVFLSCDPALGQDFSAGYWFQKGDEYFSKGSFDLAISCYNKGLDIDSSDIIAWNNKGMALANLGKYNDAIKCFDKAIELDSLDLEAWYNKGSALQAIGRYDNAIECFDEALKIDPLAASIWNNRGAALYELGKYEDAIKNYDCAISIDSKNSSQPYINKGNALRNLGRHDEAATFYRIALEVDPSQEIAQRSLEELLNKANYTQKNLICPCNGNVEMSNEEERTSFTPQKKLVLWKNPPRWETDTMLINLYSDEAKLNDQGVDYYHNGHFEDALECFEKALEINPQFEKARRNKCLTLCAMDINPNEVGLFMDMHQGRMDEFDGTLNQYLNR